MMGPEGCEKPYVDFSVQQGDYALECGLRPSKVKERGWRPKGAGPSHEAQPGLVNPKGFIMEGGGVGLKGYGERV